MDNIKQWLTEHNIEEVQCLTSDQTGVARGKIVPTSTFIDGAKVKLAEGSMLMAGSGQLIEDDILFSLIDERDMDMILKPVDEGCYLLPWAQKPTAMIIHDCYSHLGHEFDLSPRNILKKVIALYEQQGWQPIVAPEMELYLTQTCTDPNIPLQPPKGRSGYRECGRQSFGIEATDEFAPFIDDVYLWADEMQLRLDAVVHEEGRAQFEFNLVHGDPLTMADQVFVFKRMVREAAKKHGFTATFMAKPISGQPGSAMHIHQSILDANTGKNIFANDDGDTELFHYFIGGLQTYIPEVMAIFAPNVNSYKRFVAGIAAPVNLQWGLENRTVGLRVPESPVQARRIENRLPGADSNPYLAIAASMLCGYLGMMEQITPSKPSLHKCNKTRSKQLPLNFDAALSRMAASVKINEYLGERFVQAFIETRKTDYENYKNVVSSWERQYLLNIV
ncbi:glutamine synthetase family protein [Thalassotalea mangrovi]|uniref:Glutamine synthetase n=1 Tax=Thalassotalea mangrovi TaxID=2572245 RepID=A0A4U1B8A9_9GAMM|nr:glutamine synthetase family protein [Thalassotalea mangrovi]TKB46739.1 glutamine synthetase [Thalassotalea mangrovi]